MPSARTSSCRSRTTKSSTARARCSARSRATTGRRPRPCAHSTGTCTAHPGKKLMFMGCEFGQVREWNHDQSLDWHLLEAPLHGGLKQYVADLNHAYGAEPALHQLDYDPHGFEWIDCNDNDNSVISFLRRGKGQETVVAVVNFTPVPRDGYRIGVPLAGLLHGARQQRQPRLWRQQSGQPGHGRRRAAAVARASTVVAAQSSAPELSTAQAGRDSGNRPNSWRTTTAGLGAAPAHRSHHAGPARAVCRHQSRRALGGNRASLRRLFQPLLEAAVRGGPRP